MEKIGVNTLVHEIADVVHAGSDSIRRVQNVFDNVVNNADEAIQSQKRSAKFVQNSLAASFKNRNFQMSEIFFLLCGFIGFCLSLYYFIGIYGLTLLLSVGTIVMVFMNYLNRKTRTAITTFNSLETQHQNEKRRKLRDARIHRIYRLEPHKIDEVGSDYERRKRYIEWVEEQYENDCRIINRNPSDYISWDLLNSESFLLNEKPRISENDSDSDS